MSSPNIPDSSVPGLLARSQPPEAWIYDRDPANGVARATFNGEVYALTISSPAAGVSAFNGRTGSVTLDLADVEAAGGAPLASPALTGVPTAPTASAGTSSTQIATCAFVAQSIAADAGVLSFNGRTGAVNLSLGDVTGVGGAPLASPALTGQPTAPTPAVADDSSNLATTAFVNNYAAANLTLSFNGRRGNVVLTLSDVESVGGAPILSPAFTGTPTAATAAPGTATQQLATCAFVENAVVAASSGVVSFNGRTGVVTLQTADIIGAGGAPVASPALTGVPTAPTASAGTSSTQVATCAFVETAISSMAPVVTTFNGRSGAVTLALGDVTGVGGAPLASPALSGTPSSTTPAPGDDSTRIATTAFVAGAIAALPAPPSMYSENYIDNSSFQILQRAYTSGSALAAGAYGFDRWKAGAAGCTLTFPVAPTGQVAGNQAVTLTAGSLQQVVEGAGLITATYVLSWQGTAQGRIAGTSGGGTYAASPVTFAATEGANVFVEFNLGTLSQVKLQLGSAVTAWQPEPTQQALARCQRFYQGNQFFSASNYGAAGTGWNYAVLLPVQMRATPTCTMNGAPSLGNLSSIAASGVTVGSVNLGGGQAVATGSTYAQGSYNASADL